MSFHFECYLERCGKEIVVYDRNARISKKTTEVFDNPRKMKAIVKTLSGVEVFDGNNVRTVATHEFRVVYDPTIGAEQWIQMFGKSKYIRILTAENCCEDEEILVLMATERGEDSKVANTR